MKSNKQLMKSHYKALLIILLTAGILVFSRCNKKPDEAPEPLPIKHVWAVGSADKSGYATILKSDDRGNTWTRIGIGSAVLKNVNLVHLSALNDLTVWAIGSANVIVKTTDGGTSWQQVPSPIQADSIELLSIYIHNKMDIWICGSPGIIYHSPDGGNAWTVIGSEILNGRFLQGIHAVGADKIYVAGSLGLNDSRRFLAGSSNGGQSWDSIHSPTTPMPHPWIGVTSYGKDNIVVYGGASYYYYSNDGGMDWTYDSVPGTGGGGTGGADINCLTMLDEDTWWGAFDLEGIFISENSGSLWEQQQSDGPGGMWLFGIDYFDRKTCVITGCSSSSNEGKILQTTDGGQTWQMKYYADAWIMKVSVVK